MPTEPRETPATSPLSVLVVHAHPEPASITSRLKDAFVDELTRRGHRVAVSDLYADGFVPTVTRQDFIEQAHAQHFWVLEEQQHASDHDGFAPEIDEQIARVRTSDIVVLSFPLWWYSVPAILKGWIDRVFVQGFAFTATDTFAHGPLTGKSAMLMLTAGYGPKDFGPGGTSGDLDILLHHLQYGTFGYTGMSVLPMFAAMEADSADASRLAAWEVSVRQRARTLATTEPLALGPLSFGRDVPGQVTSTSPGD
jgi:NAD(P)H dehydrogenase (quinone)